MKSEEEFDAFYENSLQPKVVEIDDKRKAKVKKITFSLLAFSLVPILLIWLTVYLFQQGVFDKNGSPAALIPVLLVVCFIIIVGYGRFTLKSTSTFYSSEIKNLIIPEIIKLYEADLTYNPFKGIIAKTVEISNLFDGFNDCDNSDYIEGQMGKTFIQFSNCILIASGNRRDRIVFKGVFIVATFNKNFKGQYMVFPGRHGLPYISVPGEGVVASEEIKLENPEFTNQFSVFGTDQVEARYILSPAMMQRMLDFGHVVDDKVYFAFARNHFFIAFPTETGEFEPGLYSSLDNDQVKEWSRSIHHAISVVDAFDLNDHLWSKA